MPIGKVTGLTIALYAAIAAIVLGLIGFQTWSRLTAGAPQEAWTVLGVGAVFVATFGTLIAKARR